MKNIDISVIVTTKNEEKMLPGLLLSLSRQSFRNFETIVVDNFSTDGTMEVAKEYGIKVFSKGPERSKQRNFGVEKSNGKYVLILDADMQLSENVLEDLLKVVKKHKYAALTVPEKTVGNNFISRVRGFEREMYEKDTTIEVPRFFDKKIFQEFGGYDTKLTGPEDYDLPYRISKVYKIGRGTEYLYHNESNLTLSKLLKKKFYYAKKGALYAEKHPELLKTQGNFIFRKAYIRNWKKFMKEPFLGISFVFVKTLEMVWAILGYIQTVGVAGFIKSLTHYFK